LFDVVLSNVIQETLKCNDNIQTLIRVGHSWNLVPPAMVCSRFLVFAHTGYGSCV